MVLDCQIEVLDAHMVRMRLDNRSCPGDFCACFQNWGSGIELTLLEGDVIDIERFRYARWAAEQVLSQK